MNLLFIGDNMPKKVTVGIERLVNIGNYENIRVTSSITEHVADDADLQTAQTELSTQCKAFVQKEVDIIIAKLHGAKPRV